MSDPYNFVAEQEPWSVYRLEDGTVIRAKIVMSRVTLRENERTPEGYPVYDLKWTHIVDVCPPEMTKRDPADKVK